MKLKKKIIIIVTVVIAVVFGAAAVYVNDYYRADMSAIETFRVENTVNEDIWKDGTIVQSPEAPKAGLIFYPGGKVEYSAYVPLMEACASEGILTVLVEMPFQLAVLDIDAAEGIQEQFPEIETWYIGGHSLGGSMAAAHLGDNLEAYEGLILLGSYSTEDLSESGLHVLSVFGSEDNVMNHEKYDENKANLPSDFEEVIIEGGCHAFFGMYGAQEGDGEPSISNEEQILQTAEMIGNFVK